MKLTDTDRKMVDGLHKRQKMLLFMGGSGIIGMIRLIIGDRHENTINSLLLRLVDDHEKENSQQEDDAPSGTNP